jgi:hypothetical protein
VSKKVLGFGVVQAGGVVRVSHRTKFDSAVEREFKVGEKVALTVEKSTRTLRLNALYWFWIGIIMDTFGWKKGYTHDFCKRTFNLETTMIPNRETGELMEVSYPASTADLSIDRFLEMLTEMQQYFAEQDCDLPWPQEMK